MNKVSSACGELSFNDDGTIHFDEATVNTLFDLAISLENELWDLRGWNYIRFGTDERTKICNYIWFLLFEWSESQQKRPLKYRVVTRGGCFRSQTDWWYGFAELVHPTTNAFIGLPLPFLGRYAQAVFCGNASYIRHTAGHSNESFARKVDSYDVHEAITAIALAKTFPSWAVHDPYRTFPNFQPKGQVTCPTGVVEAGSENTALQYIRASKLREFGSATGEFSDDPEADLAQWTAASRDYHAELEEVC